MLSIVIQARSLTSRSPLDRLCSVRGGGRLRSKAELASELEQHVRQGRPAVDIHPGFCGPINEDPARPGTIQAMAGTWLAPATSSETAGETA